MADYVTHMLVARECLESIQETDKGFDARLFCLGAQGPDLLFYLAYTGLHGGTKLGKTLHDLPPETVLNLSREAEEANDFACASYLAGFALHLWVDNAVHPYINACADQYAQKTGMSLSAAHVCIESGYESWELRKKQDISIRQYRWQEDLVWENRENASYQAVIDGLEKVSLCAGKTLPPKRKIDNAMRRLPVLFTALFDRTGIFLWLVRLIGLVQKPLSATLWHVKRPLEKYPKDCLSTENRETIGQLIEVGKSRFLQAVSSERDSQ